jgi:hypothetical protein
MLALAVDEQASARAFCLYRMKARHSVISETLFHSVLNLVAYLNIQVIEGRPIEANILFPAKEGALSDALGKKTTWWGAQYIELIFLDLEEVSFKVLKRYLSCVGDPSGCLVIEGGTNGLRVGLLYVGTSLISLSASGNEDPLPRLLKENLLVRIRSGVATFQIGEDVIFAIRRGELIEAPQYDSEIRAIFLSSPGLRERCAEFVNAGNQQMETLAEIQGRPQPPITQEEVEGAISGAIREVIWRIALGEKGAILIFGLDPRASRTDGLQSDSITVNRSLVEALLREISVRRIERLSVFCNDDEYIQVRDESSVPERRAALIRMIVNLSRTDGAVIFDDRLTAISAATFIKASGRSENIGGARHRAAQSFIQQYPASIAITISQDGDVSLFQNAPAC